MHKMNTRPCPESADPSQLEDIKKHLSRKNLAAKIAAQGRDVDINRPRNLNEADIQRTSNVSIVYTDVNSKEKHVLVKYDALRKQNSLKDSDLAEQDKLKGSVIPKTDDSISSETDKKQQQKLACPECGYYLPPKPSICKECGQIKKKQKERCRGCGQVVHETCQDCGQRMPVTLSFGEMAAFSQYKFEMARARRGYYDDWSSSTSSSCLASTSRKFGFGEENASDYDDVCGCAECQKEKKKNQKPCVIADSKTALRRSTWKRMIRNIFSRYKTVEKLDDQVEAQKTEERNTEQENSTNVQPAENAEVNSTTQSES